jgi:hypothetical protein
MLNVLVWGTVADGPCAFFRGHLYDAPLKALGVDMRHVSSLGQSPRFLDRHDEPVEAAKLSPEKLLAMLQRGDVRLDSRLDLEPLRWADVILFRRYYNGGRDTITPAVWEVVERMHDGPAIVYDTDDLLIGGAPRWNSLCGEIEAAEGMVKRMTRRADLVSCSTPMLARHLAPLNPNVRVIRNAVDASMYTAVAPRPEGDRARVVLYGNLAKLRDWAGHPSKAVADYRHRVRTVWLGAERGEVRGFDEVHPYVRGLPAFCRTLGNLHPDIGMAPIADDTPFDRSKSELHWLEFSAAGAATIAQRMGKGPDSGPYSIIRDGVDGVLAKGRQEWSDGLKLLLDPNRRADIAGAARERVLRDYDYRDRAVLWRDAFVWAAEHAGIGLRAA